MQHGRERIGRVRVVDDDGERLSLLDRLEATRDGAHARDALGDGVLVEVEKESRRDGAEHVLDVEEPAQGRLDVDPAARKRLPVAVELETLRRGSPRLGEAERDERRAVGVAQIVREPPPPLVADVDRGGRRLRRR